MANLHHMIVNAGRLVMVGVLFFLLQGCHTPLVKIDVAATTEATTAGECQSDDNATDKDVKDPLTGCRSRSWSGSADGFWHQADDYVIPAGSGYTCNSGSKKCRSASNCSGGNTCTSTYLSSGYCVCACGQT